jgi:hypothetical protein
MDKKGLLNIITEVLTPFGFKRKTNSWTVEANGIIKIVNLQKSAFSNSFYINYGFIVKAIPLTTRMHIHKGVGSIEKNIQQRINEILNLDSPLDDLDRAIDLKQIISDQLVSHLSSIQNEDDLLNYLKKRPHLNDIPLIVKKHFNIN